MDSLNFLKNYLRLVGILRENSNGSGKIYGIASNCFLFGFSMNYTVTTLWNFLSKPETFSEYAESFFFLSSSLLHLKLYSILFWQREQYADLLIDLEIIIEKSKHKFLFFKCNFQLA